jgi:alkylation response protein AidB-like acyl-CoA dehydrogenase
MVAPTILAHGSDVAKDLYLQRMYRAELVGCQLFSEPGAGSDLASLQTKAVRDGDEWIITGQKVWTTGAQFSDIGEIIARTDPDLPKHKGLTGFIVDMHAPGVEISRGLMFGSASPPRSNPPGGRIVIRSTRPGWMSCAPTTTNALPVVGAQ